LPSCPPRGAIAYGIPKIRARDRDYGGLQATVAREGRRICADLELRAAQT
jgi:hypothetical protein